MKQQIPHQRRALRPGLTTTYHVFSHFGAEVPYLENREKEVFLKQLWKTAYSCGLEVLTFSILSNHFHILLRVPAKITMDDWELLKRYRVLYPKPNKFQTKCLEDYERELAAGGDLAAAARKELLERMGDLSKFMQLLKQRFSIWYNKTRSRKGTLWAGRFKSVLVEDNPDTLKVVGAYIDLNAVRAGLVKDPKNYRFCGYGQWAAGEPDACEAFQKMFSSTDLDWVMAQYRLILYGKGVLPKSDRTGVVLDQEKAREVLASGGQLSAAERLLCRTRNFRDACVIGSRQFVGEQIPFLRKIGATRRKSNRSFAIPGFEATGLRGLRQLHSESG